MILRKEKKNKNFTTSLEGASAACRRIYGLRRKWRNERRHSSGTIRRGLNDAVDESASRRRLCVSHRLGAISCLRHNGNLSPCSRGAVLTTSVSFSSLLAIFFQFNSWQTSVTSGSNGQRGARRDAFSANSYNVATHHSPAAWRHIRRQLFVENKIKKTKKEEISSTTDDNMQLQCPNDALWAHYSPCSHLITLLYTAVPLN